MLVFVQETVQANSVCLQVIGDPLNRNTQHGPQNHLAHLEKLVNYCEKAVREGATLVYGGHRVNRPGYFFQPTVFVDVEDHMFIATEEAFGPIMAISKFSSRYDSLNTQRGLCQQ